MANTYNMTNIILTPDDLKVGSIYYISSDYDENDNIVEMCEKIIEVGELLDINFEHYFGYVTKWYFTFMLNNKKYTLRTSPDDRFFTLEILDKINNYIKMNHKL
jgi:hypothetical protein